LSEITGCCTPPLEDDIGPCPGLTSGANICRRSAAVLVVPANGLRGLIVKELSLGLFRPTYKDSELAGVNLSGGGSVFLECFEEFGGNLGVVGS
jgi:hypothetical protein